MVLWKGQKLSSLSLIRFEIDLNVINGKSLESYFTFASSVGRLQWQLPCREKKIKLANIILTYLPCCLWVGSGDGGCLSRLASDTWVKFDDWTIRLFVWLRMGKKTVKTNLQIQLNCQNIVLVITYENLLENVRRIRCLVDTWRRLKKLLHN